MLTQHSLDAPQADTELLSHLLGRRARPLEIDHCLEIIRREAITQPSRANHVLRNDLGTRAIVLTIVWV
jgi:hypothetical protein